MHNSLVSIITPMYNSEKYIKETISSVKKQTYTNWEMIIIDDGSSDGSVGIVNNILIDDDRINLIVCNENKGSAIARNKGIKKARGRFIAFLDSDDIWLPDKLYIQLKFMLDNKYSFSFTSYEKINENNDILSKVSIKIKKVSYYELLKTNYIGCLTAIIDIELIGEKIYMPLIEKRQDHALWLAILNRGHFAYGLNKSLAQYRLHPKSLSNNKIKIVFYQWKLYREVEQLNFFSSLYYMFYYAYNGFFKWIE